MRKFMALPIRVHMFLLVLLLALPAIGVIVYSGIRQREEAIIDAGEDVEKRAHEIASEVTLLVDNIRQLSLALSHLPAVQSRNSAILNPLLKELLSHYPYYTTIFITDEKGEVLASSRPNSPRHSLADRRYFKEAVATGQFSSGEYAIGRVSGLPTLSFGYPFKDKHGAVRGVIGVSLDLRVAARVFVHKKLSDDVTCSIFDHKGTYLFRSVEADRFVGTQDRQQLLKLMQEGGEEGAFEMLSNDGVQRRVVYQKLRLPHEKAPYMYIRAGTPVASARQAANAAMLNNLIVIAPFLMAALVLAWFVSKRCIVDRVEILQSAGRSLAAGNLDTRIGPLVSGGELGELAHTFDGMADSLQLHEQKLRAGEQHLRRVLDSLFAFVGVMTPDGTLIDANRAALEAVGVGIHEVAGRAFEDTPWWSWSPEAQYRLRDAITRAAAGETSRYDVLQKMHDGELCPVDFMLAPLRDDHGVITHLIPSAIDISDRKRAELALQQAHDDLEQRVNIRTGELAAAVVTLKNQVADRKKAELALRESQETLQRETAQRVRALEQLRENERSMIQQGRQAAMGEMISNIAHQWRQPLNTLGLHIQRLGLFHDIGTLNKEQLDSSIGESMRLIRHMSATIDDFRNFFSTEKTVVNFSVNEAISQTVSLVEASFKNQQINLSIQTEGDPHITGYPNEFSQALLNILLNARDALVERNVTDTRIALQSFTQDGRAVVVITDNAGGIPDGIMEKIFDPHFTTKGSHGTGIGLFMAKNIIERSMNGRLSARNIESGAEFRIEV